MFLGIGTDTRWISDTCVQCLVPAVLSSGRFAHRLLENKRREVVLVFKDDLPLNEFVEVRLPPPVCAPMSCCTASLCVSAKLADWMLS